MTEIFPIEYMKSALSINTHFGCTLSCQYCIVQEVIGNSKKPDFKLVKMESPHGLVEKLKHSPLFVPGKTLLVINNKTDPLISGVKDNTINVLELLNLEGYQNPVMLISKMGLSADDITQLEEYRGNLYYLFSSSGMPNKVEPISGRQLNMIENLRGRKRISAIHYWRPIVAGLNDSNGTIEQVLDAVAPFFDSSVISGLRITPEIIARLTPFGGRFENWNGDRNHKFLPEGFLDRAFKIRDQRFKDYPLFLKTSCAISSLEEVSDYNFNYMKNQKQCRHCSNSLNCNLGPEPQRKVVDELMGRLGIDSLWAYGPSSIYINGEASTDQLSFLSFNLKYPVRAKSTRGSTFESSLGEIK